MHISFIVQNFIFSDHIIAYQLLPIDKLILIALARHIGQNLYCWPSIPMLSKELEISSRFLMKRLEFLEQKKLLLIEKKLGKTNHYSLQIPPVMTRELQDTGELQFTGENEQTRELQFTGLEGNSDTKDNNMNEISSKKEVTRELQFTQTIHKIKEKDKRLKKGIVKGKQVMQKIELPEWLSVSDWDDFLEHRKSMKAPMSFVAQKRMIAGLKKLRMEGENVSEVLNQSIVNGWKGIFPVKKNNQSKPKEESLIEKLQRGGNIIRELRSGNSSNPFAQVLGDLGGEMDKKH